MSRRQDNNERVCEYTISGTNLNANKIKHELHQCGIREVNISPCGRNIKIRVKDPNEKQLEVINRHFDSKDNFPDFKDNFKKDWKYDWDSDSFSF